MYRTYKWDVNFSNQLYLLACFMSTKKSVEEANSCNVTSKKSTTNNNNELCETEFPMALYQT